MSDLENMGMEVELDIYPPASGKVELRQPHSGTSRSFLSNRRWTETAWSCRSRRRFSVTVQNTWWRLWRVSSACCGKR